MAQQTDSTDARLTEYLPATANKRGTLEGPAKITVVKDARGIWVDDAAKELNNDPDEYRVECSCGEVYHNWGAATQHAEKEH